MPIQILGFRESLKQGKAKKSLRFFNNNWRAPSIPHLLDNYRQYLNEIPENERYNIQFTVADCIEEHGRKMQRQDCIFFDIDNVDLARAAEYIPVVARGIGVDPDEIAVIVSGHGLHVIVQFQAAWLDTDFYEKLRPYYKAICLRINKLLLEFPLVGFADPEVFADTRMIRMPGTMNVKKGRAPAPCSLIHNKLKALPISLEKLIDLRIDEVMQEDQISPNIIGEHVQVDGAAVQEKCGFIKHCKENPKKIREPAWYAMLSILSRLPEGESLCHEYSKGHPGYTQEETDLKIEQAKNASGPRTCKNISTMFDGCQKCPHRTRVTSPILLKGDDFIKTSTTGFRNLGRDKNGNLIRKDPNYDDLLKHFQQTFNYKVEKQSGSVYVYGDGLYSMMERFELENFAEKKIDPAPMAREVSEFVRKVQRTNLVAAEFFNVPGKLNCRNGVLDLKTFKLSPHGHEYGLTHKLNYDYSATATCPSFDKFLNEITSGMEEKKTLILQYMGYALSAVDPSVGQKALILVGEGANGKSVLVETFGKLVGDGNFTTLTMADLRNEQMRAFLQHKFFILSEETPTRSLYDSTEFKNLVTGGKVRAKIVHKPPFEFKNTAKFIFCCNELPRNFDKSYGMNRRLLICRFTEEYSDEKKNRDPLLHEKLAAEMPGILNRVIEGYLSFSKGNKFSEGELTKREVEEYALENNTVAQWCGDRCSIEESSLDYYSVQDLYFDYQNWMRETNPSARQEVEPKLVFVKLLSKHAPCIVKKRVGLQKSVCYRGIVPLEDFASPVTGTAEGDV